MDINRFRSYTGKILHIIKLMVTLMLLPSKTNIIFVLLEMGGRCVSIENRVKHYAQSLTFQQAILILTTIKSTDINKKRKEIAIIY